MVGNDFANQPISIVGNPSMQSLVNNRLLEKGEYNTENKVYQWADKFFHWTTRLANPTLSTDATKAAYFAVLSDSVGNVAAVLSRCDFESPYS